MKATSFGLLFLIALSSCKKDDAPAQQPGSNVKLKTIVQSNGGGKAEITSFEYDASGRVTKLNQVSQDSAFTPVRVTYANYHAFYYNGTSTLPYKNIMAHEAGRPADTVYYYFDASNRITKDEVFDGSLFWRNTYSYPNATTVLKDGFYRSTGGALQMEARDSTLLSGNTASVTFIKGAFATDKMEFSYDTKNNPFSGINVYQSLYSFFGEDRLYQRRAANNETLYRYVSGTDTTSITSTYTYLTNNYPASARLVRYNTFSGTRNSSLTFTYY